jgi:transcriptional regulator
MNDELLKEIKKMNKLLAFNLTKGQDKVVSILQLVGAGYTQSEVATILGTTAKAVESALYHHKKKQKENGKTKKGGENEG